MSAALSLYSFFSCLAMKALGWLYDHRWLRVRRVPLPVLSVGNITLGGSGKTPLALAILERLLADGFRPALVTRGYRGLWEKDGGILSDGNRVRGGWREAGDEPAMLARRLPGAGVFVGRRRRLSCLRASDLGFDVVVLDDGFQHRRLHRDLDIVLFEPGVRSGRREFFSALERADIVALPEDFLGHKPAEFRLRGLARKAVGYKVVPRLFLPVRTGNDGPGATLPAHGLRGARALAFCGIARPERFFLTLERLGLILMDKIAFPDHYEYPAGSGSRILDRGRELGVEVLLTTEKDAVKCEGQLLSAGEPPLYALRIDLSPEARLHQAVAGAIGAFRRSVL